MNPMLSCRLYLWKAPRSTFWLALFIQSFVLFGSSVTFGRVKLITLPVRERVELQLDNPNATLVEEERIVPLVQGENQVDFSWANTQIDPNTIVFRVLGPAEDNKLDVNVLSVSYPPKEASLVWTVSASKSGSARVRISYLLGNLTKSYNYRAVASHDETTLNLAQYMRMQNLANEQFHDTGLWAGFGPHFHKEIGINETKEVLIEKFAAVPITKTYTCNPAEFNYIDRAQNKLRVPMHYMLKNDAAHGLGKATLEYGKVRIFVEGVGENDKTSTTFLGEDWGKFTPKDDELRLYLGVAQDIVVKRTIERNHMHHVTGNLYRYDAVIKYEIENFKHEPVTLNLVEDARYVRKEIRPDTEREVDWELGKETTFEGGLDKEHSNAERLAFRVNLPAASSDGKAPKVTHKLHLLIKNEW